MNDADPLSVKLELEDPEIDAKGQHGDNMETTCKVKRSRQKSVLWGNGRSPEDAEEKVLGGMGSWKLPHL